MEGWGILFNKLKIRDAGTYQSKILQTKGYTLRTLISENGLDKDVSIQCYASANKDFSNSFKICNPSTLLANTSDFESWSQGYFPYFRLEITLSEAPTDGEFSAQLFRQGGKN